MLKHYPLKPKYVKGVENVVADALSRRPDHESVDSVLHSLCEVEGVDVDVGVRASVRSSRECRRRHTGHSWRALWL